MASIQRSLPRPGNILREQFRTVSQFIAPRILLVATPLALTVAAGLIILSRSPQPISEGVDVWTESFILLVFLGFVFPVAVWWGEPVRKRSYHLSMPASQKVLYVSRAASGLVWLLAIVFTTVLGAWLITAVAGGRMGVYPSGDGGSLVPLWFWITPLVSATIAYTFGSALVIGARHPVPWGMAAVYVPMVIAELIESSGPLGNLLGWMDRLAHGPVGFVPVLTGLTKRMATTPQGNGIPVVDGMHPVFGIWLTSAATWSLLAAIALAIASRRHRDS